MKTIQEILDFVHSFGARCVVVTKYGDAHQTRLLYEQVKDHPAFWALGENRIEQMKTKKIKKEHMHFIGHVQSRALKQVPEYASVVHSICTIKHAKMVAACGLPCFLQVNIGREKNKDGIMPEAFGDFFEGLKKEVPNLEILGVSGMGKFVCLEDEKREEFRGLKQLRDEYVPGGMISAGTSGDFEIALEEGVDVVRLGRVLWDKMESM